MRTTRHTLLAITLLLIVLGSSAAQDGKTAEKFSGKYDWSAGGTDKLSADFEPDGKGSWKVTFHFRFNGRNETWKGTAKGSLDDGSTLDGTATFRKRNWIFEAGIENGVMRGSHREIKRSGREYPTGTFELSR